MFNIKKNKSTINTYRDATLITYNNPKSPVSEAYRALRTNLGFAAIDKECRSIMFTSSVPMEGKSTTIANLAVTLAQAGHKTVLVDCDLRRPVLHNIFKMSNQQGITNCLIQKKSIEEVGYTSFIDNLLVVGSGPIPPNPAELLQSNQARALWTSILEEYDYLLIDTPPLLAVTDAAILASQVEGVVLVVTSGRTRTEMAKGAKDQLQKANANIIGVVINQAKVDSNQYYYYSQDFDNT